jgi:hypothetical protein
MRDWRKSRDTCFIFEYFFSKYALAVSALAMALSLGSLLPDGIVDFGVVAIAGLKF